MNPYVRIAFLATLCLLTGCEDTFEPDESDETPAPEPAVSNDHAAERGDLDALATRLDGLTPEERKKESEKVERDVTARRAEVIRLHITNLRDRDPEVRQTAAQILGQMGALEAIPDLIETLKDSHVYVQIYAHGALNKLTGKNFGYKNYDGWSQWWQSVGGDLDTFLKNRKAGTGYSRRSHPTGSYPVAEDSWATYREMLAASLREPDNPERRNNLGLIIMELARSNPYRYIDAIDQFAAAMRLDPSLPQPYVNTGTCFAKLGKDVEAQDWYRRGFKVDTHGVLWEHAWQIGKEQLKKGNYPEALEYLNVARTKAELQQHRDARIHRDLALTCYALERYGDAWKEIGVVKELGYDLTPEFVGKVKTGLRKAGGGGR